MSDDIMCDEYSGNLAELALGILTGRERVATLAHVESCAHCTDELERLSGRPTPYCIWFLRSSRPSVSNSALWPHGKCRGRIRRHAPQRWLLACAAAVIALAVGLSIGLSTGSSHSNTRVAQQTHPTRSKPVLTGRLIGDGGTVGWCLCTEDPLPC